MPADGRRERPSRWRRVAVAGALGLLGLAAAGPLLAPYDPAHAFRDAGLSAAGYPLGPGGAFLLGTDPAGRDELSRLLAGARPSILVALGGSLLATAIGLIVGAVAGFAGDPLIDLGGRRLRLPVESLLMRTTDVFLGLPPLLLALALTAVLRPSLLLVLLVVGLTLWTTVARVVYGRVRSLRDAPFVEAARALGVGPGRVLWRHVLPHVSAIVLVYLALGMAAAVLLESSLSFLGLGLPPAEVDWGSMIAEATPFALVDPRLVVLPGGALMVTVLTFVLLGDAAAGPVARGRR